MKKLAMLALPLVMASCGSDNGGGSKSNNSTTVGASITSQFVDAPVKGMNVVGSVSGTKKTGDNGKFSCTNGEELTFSLASIEIGKANCNSWIHLFDLTETVNHDVAASMIQSLATGTSVLDLTAFNAHASASTLNPGTFNATFVTNLDIDGLNYVDAPTANTRAESFLKDLSSDPVLSDISEAGPQTITMKGLSTNDQEECWETAQLKMNLEAVGKAYRLNISQYKAFDGSTEPDAGICNDVSYYDCAENPFSKIITGRNINATRYAKETETFTKDQVIGCFNTTTEEMTELDGASCPGGTVEVTVAKDQSFTNDFGANLNIQVTDTGAKFNFSETYDDLEAVQVGETTSVNFKKQRYTCRYSTTLSFE